MAFVGLHTASPGTTGANETTGGGYARQACTWNTASAGSKTNSAAMTFSTGGVTPITHLCPFSLVTAGVPAVGSALASAVTAATITVAAGAI
ncbi:MAG: phage tail fiber protein, partial [Nocardioides sp.]